VTDSDITNLAIHATDDRLEEHANEEAEKVEGMDHSGDWRLR
jgi:hypothetical protein